MNVLAELGKRHRITQVQIRLIVLEMKKQMLDDQFGLDRQQQEKLFVDIVTRILNVPARVVSELL